MIILAGEFKTKQNSDLPAVFTETTVSKNTAGRSESCFVYKEISTAKRCKNSLKLMTKGTLTMKQILRKMRKRT